MGAAFVLQRLRGVDPMQSGLGPVILLNLGITFLIPNISIGGHIGGLIGGALAGFAMEQIARRRRGIALPVLACVVVGVLAVAGALAVAGSGNSSIGIG
jgi:membrane associated rhomboid family serine protease